MVTHGFVIGTKMAHPRETSAALFRRRMQELIGRSGHTTAGFARLAGVDRSTLSQLLDGDEPRLPRADTLIAVAGAAHVSTDWLLGLSQREETGAEIIEAMLQIEAHAGGPVDDRFMAWLNEAEGYRIRTVPVALPDFVKTEAVLAHEYGSASPQQRAIVRARLDYMCGPDTDVEVGLGLQTLQAFAAGEDVWRDLPLADRLAQLEHLAAIYRTSYPGLRLYLYDLRTVYSAPFTVFGPKRAVVFLGPSYLVLNGSEHIRLFARRFDGLIRLAAVQPHGIGAFLDGLIATLR